MAKYEVTAPDGRVFDVNAPDGATPDEVLAFAQQQFAQQAQMPSPEQMQEPTGTAERVLTGVTDPMFGAAQLITKGGAALRIPGFTGVTGLAASVDDYIKQREAEYVPPEGVDLARLAGNIVSPVNWAIPGGAIKGAATGGNALRGAYQGAKAGAIAGAAQPVMGDDYLGEKAAQVGAGTALGAGGGAILQKASEGLSAVSNRLRAGQIDPAQLRVEIETTLGRQGIDFAALDQDIQQQVTAQVQRAARAGTQVDPQALANLATLRQAGIESPTLGQITQNPTQFGTELFLRSQEGGAELASQYQNAVTALNRRLAEVGGRYPAPLNNPEAGARVMQGLRAAAERGDSYEDALWGIAREQMGRDTPIGDPARFARSTIQRLEDENLWDPQVIPGGIRQRLMRLNNGEDQLTIDVAERLKNSLNQARELPTAQGAGARNAALGMIRRELEQFLDTATGAEQMRGIEFFRQARSASRDRRLLEEAIPALEDIRYAGSETAPDDFMRKFVTSRSVEVSNLSAMRDFLMQADPTAWQQIKGQVLHDIYLKSTKDEPGKFLQGIYNQQIRSLMESGKYDVLFSAAERRVLENIGKAGKLIEGPQGVPRTGLLGGARSAEVLSRIISSMGRLVPGIGQYAAEPIAAAVRSAPVQAATRQAINPDLTRITP